MAVSKRKKHDDSVVKINPISLFLIVFIMPYLLFFLLMMAVTGLIQPLLILEVIIQKSSVDFIKIWVIGSFVFSIILTMYISGLGVKDYVQTTLNQRPKLSGGSKIKEEFLDEPLPSEKTVHSSAAKLPTRN